MSLHGHSSITMTIEVPDFDCLQRQFQTRLSHLLCRAPPRAGCAATSNPMGWLSPVQPQLNACCRRREATLLCPVLVQQRAQGRRWPTAVAGSVSCCTEHHCPATAANQLQMYCAACHPPATDDGAYKYSLICSAFPAAFIAWHTAWHIACCHITPFCGI